MQKPFQFCIPALKFHNRTNITVEIAWKQNILVTDFHLLKSLLDVFGFGSQAFVCGFSRQNINSAPKKDDLKWSTDKGAFSIK